MQFDHPIYKIKFKGHVLPLSLHIAVRPETTVAWNGPRSSDILLQHTTAAGLRLPFTSPPNPRHKHSCTYTPPPFTHSYTWCDRFLSPTVCLWFKKKKPLLSKYYVYLLLLRTQSIWFSTLNSFVPGVFFVTWELRRLCVKHLRLRAQVLIRDCEGASSVKNKQHNIETTWILHKCLSASVQITHINYM